MAVTEERKCALSCAISDRLRSQHRRGQSRELQQRTQEMRESTLSRGRNRVYQSAATKGNERATHSSQQPAASSLQPDALSTTTRSGTTNSAFNTSLRVCPTLLSQSSLRLGALCQYPFHFDC